MKFMVLSDLHGSLSAFERAAEIFERDGFDWLILCGDYLNHGPRNGIPTGHDPLGLAKALNRFADRIVAVRGNCDGEVDQMLLEFPCLADYATVLLEGRRIVVTHGHLWGGVEAMTGGPGRRDGIASPPIRAGDILVSGHTHIAGLGSANGVILANPGSPVFPKNGTGMGYATLTGERIELVDFERGTLDAMDLR